MAHVPQEAHHFYENDNVALRYTYKSGVQFTNAQVQSAEWRSDKLDTKTVGSGISLSEDADQNTIFTVDLGQVNVSPGMVTSQLLVDIGNGLTVIAEDYFSVSPRLA